MGFDIKTEITQIVEELENACDYDFDLSEDVSDRLEEEVYPLLKVEKPKIMVYGIYNAGKSTLINALYGKEVAEVKDAPMTYKISEFDVGDYVLVDSPGVDAPIEHERVTNSYLKNCHVILYVISTKGGFESRKNYENLYNLIKIGKPFIIVINDKNAEKDLNQSEIIKDIKFKILENLATVSGESNLDQKYDIIAVNGNRGKPGLKPALYKLSNIDGLKERIEYFLKNKNAMAMYAAPIGNIIKIIDDIIENIQDTFTTENNNAKNLLSRIRYERVDIIEQLPSRIQSIIGNYYDAFYSSLLNANEDNWDSIFDSISIELETEFDEVKEKIKYLLSNSEVRDFDIDDIDLFLNNIARQMPEIEESASESKKITMDYEPEKSSEALNTTLAIIGSSNPVVEILGKVVSKVINGKREKEKQEFQRLQAETEMQNNLAVERATQEANKRQQARMHVETTIHNISSQTAKEMTESISRLFDYIQNYILAYITQNENELKEKKKFINLLQDIKRKSETLKNSI